MNDMKYVSFLSALGFEIYEYFQFWKNFTVYNALAINDVNRGQEWDDQETNRDVCEQDY